MMQMTNFRRKASTYCRYWSCLVILFSLVATSTCELDLKMHNYLRRLSVSGGRGLFTFQVCRNNKTVQLGLFDFLLALIFNRDRIGPCQNDNPTVDICPSGQRKCNGSCLDSKACCPNPTTGCCPLTEKACDGSCIDATKCCNNDDCTYAFACNVASDRQCEPAPLQYCMAQCYGSFQSIANSGSSGIVDISGRDTPQDFPASISAFGTTIRQFQLQPDVFGAMDFVDTVGGVSNRPLHVGLVTPSPSAGKTYTKWDGFDLFTISWEGWRSSITGADLNVQVRFDIWTGDFRICYGPGSLSSTCSSASSPTTSEAVRTAFMSCQATIVPFGVADPDCSSSTAEAGTSWVWPNIDSCICGNLNYFT